MEVHARAAVKRSETPPTARIFVHAELLNDPVKRLNRKVLRRLGCKPLELDSRKAAEAICSRYARVLYRRTFQPEAEDNPCPECTQLMTILQQNPEQCPETESYDVGCFGLIKRGVSNAKSPPMAAEIKQDNSRLLGRLERESER